MDSLYFPKINENTNTSNIQETFSNSFKKNKENKDINSSEPFKAFSSALFMSEYQENEETLIHQIQILIQIRNKKVKIFWI